MKTYVQQIMLGTVTGSEEAARATLRRVRAAGYDGLELNRFMTRPTSLMVRLLTKAAGMPTGRGGKLDWPKLMGESGLETVSYHADLGSLEREPAAVAQEAKTLGTDRTEINRMLVSSALMRELCYQDREYRWHAIVRQQAPHEGLYEFSGWYGTVAEFLAENEEQWLRELPVRGLPHPVR